MVIAHHLAIVWTRLRIDRDHSGAHAHKVQGGRVGEVMRPQALFLAGLVLGTLLGLAFLLAPITFIPGLAVWAWLVGRRPRFLGASGALVGFGMVWLLVIGQAGLRCAIDATCSQPDLTPWLVIGVVILCGGVLVGLASYRRMNPGGPSLTHQPRPPPAR
jgi:hypothetical protein